MTVKHKAYYLVSITTKFNSPNLLLFSSVSQKKSDCSNIGIVFHLNSLDLDFKIKQLSIRTIAESP